MEGPYRICTRCVMDTSDPNITFDEKGVCNHCRKHDYLVSKFIHSGNDGRRRLEKIVEGFKKEGEGKQYDCVIGVSGGVDSSHVAYLVKKLGLRPLAVHLDNGWDSELSHKNIELLLNKLDIDLYTYVMDWEMFRDLQLAFLRSSTPDTEIPTDHAIYALLHEKAEEFGLRHIINGCNVRTETHVPLAWSYDNSDWRYVKNINQLFGTGNLKGYPHYNMFQKYLYKTRIEWFSILNYVDYRKWDAVKILEDEMGWRYYGGKHYESIWTRFYQGYILPRKFGYDKRRSHLSALICSNETTREKALEEMKGDPYPPNLLRDDLDFVLKKFELTPDEFEAMMAKPKKTYLDYPSYGRMVRPIVDSEMYGAFRNAYWKIWAKGTEPTK